MLKKLTVVLFAFSFVFALASCEGTLKGVGSDIEKMGKSIKDSVNSDKKD